MSPSASSSTTSRPVPPELRVSSSFLNAQDARGWTALSLAIRYGHTQVVRTLLECGARPVTGDTLGNALLIAVDLNDLQTLRLMDCSAEEVVSANRQGCQPLHLAAENAYVECCEYLLERGAAVNAQDGDGDTPLLLATQQLRIHSAQSSSSIHPIDASTSTSSSTSLTSSPVASSTPGVSALVDRYLRTCALLMKHAADCRLSNKEGRSPVSLLAGLKRFHSFFPPEQPNKYS